MVSGTGVVVRVRSRAEARRVALALSKEHPSRWVFADPPAPHYGSMVCRGGEVLLDDGMGYRPCRFPKGRNRKLGVFGRVRRMVGPRGEWWAWWVECRYPRGAGWVLRTGGELRECDARAIVADEVEHLRAVEAARRRGRS